MVKSGTLFIEPVSVRYAMSAMHMTNIKCGVRCLQYTVYSPIISTTYKNGCAVLTHIV